MSGIAVKEATPAEKKAHAEAVEKTVAMVLSGKSRELSRLAKAMTEAEASALVEAGKYLSNREGQAQRGLAVVTYTLLESGAYTVRQDLAQDIGVVPSRVTQLHKEGRAIVTLGLPEGWKTPVSLTAVRALTQGKGSKDLGELLDSDLPVAEKRAKVAGIVKRLQDEAAQAKATAQAQRDAEKAEKEAKAKAGKNGAPEVSKASAATDTTDAALADAVAGIVSGVTVLTGPGAWDRLSEKQQQAVAAAVAAMVKASE